MKYKLEILIALLISCFICNSCGKIVGLFSKNIDTEYQTDIKSKHNDDNSILTVGKEYLYKVVQKDKDRILHFDLILKAIPGSYSGGTKIKYKHYYNEQYLTTEERNLYIDTVKNYKWDITSAHESSDLFYLHPPRSYTLTRLEIAPFPEVELPVVKGRKSSMINNIVSGYGEYDMSRVYFQYIVEDVVYKTDSSYVAKIKGSSNWGKEEKDNKICNVDFEFDSTLGFTKLFYSYTDSTSIEFTMENSAK